MIKLRNLNKYFFKGKKNQIHVLNDVSLELEEKGLVAIHGASGSGKTTLLNVIGGLDKTNSGEIDFFEEYIPKYKSRVWDKIRNESVGFVFQNYYLLPNLSVYENVRLVLKNIGLSDEKEIETRVNYVLTALGMYSFRKKKALQLSGGQQQRVAIARALVKNPKVIIADEPTGNLDSKNTIEIMNIIKEISKETLVILVTHENEIANVYADRIITLEDGKIISDDLNEERNEHNVVDDTIYLKDIKNQEEIANEKVKINVYYNKDLKDVNVKLILKNNTLYVDVDGYKDVKLVNNAKDVVIKDAHYVKKTKEEVTKTSFDVNVLDHKNVKREKKFLFSIKSLFLDVFKKLLTYGRKGKLMLFSFLIAGMIVAYAVTSFAAVLIIDAEDTISLPKGYIEYYYEDRVTIDELMSAKGSATEFYINPYYQNVPIEFLKSDGTVGITENNHVDRIEHAKKYKLLKGRHATEINEIVVSKGFADAFLDSAKAQEFGIWSLNDLFKEKIRFTNVDAKIVGVVDKSTPLIFASEEFLVYNYNFSHYYTFKPVEAFTNFVPIKGTLPANSKDILINEISLNIYGKDINTVTFPFTATFPEPANGVDTLFNVVGVHDVEGVDVILKSDDIKGFMIDMYPYGHIYTDKPKETITNLNNLGLEAVDIFSEAMQELKMSRTQVLASTAISTLILVGATLVGFYFIIKSSLIEKIFEVAVLRSLGVKKREIMGSFMVEIIVLTTISSFIGYSLMSYILSLMSKGFIGMFISFKVNPFTYLSGLILIYMLNLLAGLLPVFGLLRKTPAQILTQYDI